MVTEELLKYVEYQLTRGIDRNSIKMTLLQNGWSGEDINEAFSIVSAVTNTKPADPYVPGYSAANVTEGAALGGADANVDPGAATTTTDFTEQSQPTAEPITQSSPLEAARSALSGEQQSVTYPTQAQSPLTANPEISTGADNNLSDELKYRTAGDWQRDNYAAATSPDSMTANQPPAQTQPQTQSPAQMQPHAQPQQPSTQPDSLLIDQVQQPAQPVQSASEAPIESQAQPADALTGLGKAASALQSAAASAGPQVLRPKINDLASRAGGLRNLGQEVAQATQGVQAVGDQLQNVQDQMAAIAQPAGPPPQVAQQPASAETFQQPKSRRGLKKVLISAFLGIAFAGLAVGVYYLYTNMFSGPDYSLVDVVRAVERQSSFTYRVSGETTASADVNRLNALAWQQLNEGSSVDFGFVVLNESTTGNSASSISIGGLTADYIYENNNLYLRVRSLPSGIRADIGEGLENRWFILENENDIRLINRLMLDSQISSPVILVNDFMRSVRSLTATSLAQETYLGRNSGNSAVDEFRLDFDLSNIESLFDGETALIWNELTRAFEVDRASAIVLVERNTQLPLRMEVSLFAGLDNVRSGQITVNFDFQPQQRVAFTFEQDLYPTSEVLQPLEALTYQAIKEQIDNQLLLLASDISIHNGQTGSYIGACESESLVGLRLAVSGAGLDGDIECNENDESFAVQVPLPGGSFFNCIDAQFSSFVTATALGDSTSCGERVSYAPSASLSPVVEDDESELVDQE